VAGLLRNVVKKKLPRICFFFAGGTVTSTFLVRENFLARATPPRLHVSTNTTTTTIQRHTNVQKGHNNLTFLFNLSTQKLT
jgi:hypothetical protein